MWRELGYTCLQVADEFLMEIHDKFDLRILLSDIICDWLCEDGSCMTEGEHHEDNKCVPTSIIYSFER